MIFDHRFPYIATNASPIPSNPISVGFPATLTQEAIKGIGAINLVTLQPSKKSLDLICDHNLIQPIDGFSLSQINRAVNQGVSIACRHTRGGTGLLSAHGPRRANQASASSAGSESPALYFVYTCQPFYHHTPPGYQDGFFTSVSIRSGRIFTSSSMDSLYLSFIPICWYDFPM